MNNVTPINPAGFTKRQGGTIMDANRQWANRRPDEAVWTVDDLLTRTGRAKQASTEQNGVAWSDLLIGTDDAGELMMLAGDGPLRFSNYSFGQLCGLPVGPTEAGLAPAHFVSQLSAETAAHILNERLQLGVSRDAPASLLLGARADRNVLRSVTTDRYERVWDHDLALRVAAMCERGTWGPAQAFRRAGQAPQNEGGLPLGWVGDRSMFVALVDYDGAIEHKGSTYARFFLLSNSEVGAASLKITFGLLDFVCCNFILWGCTEVYEATFRHTKSIHERVAVVGQGIKALSSGERSGIVEGIDAARAYLLGDNEKQVIATTIAATDLPRNLVTDAWQRAQATSRYGDPRSAWGMLNGLTEASQVASGGLADKRTAVDIKAARLMGLLDARKR